MPSTKPVPPKIAVVDCATDSPAYQCFNHLVHHLNRPIEYHLPPAQGLESLHLAPPASAYILFGSVSDVKDRLTWQKNLAQFAGEKLQQKIPVLGICFGHQLMSDYFGGPVDLVHESAQIEEGTREMMLKENFGDLKAMQKLRVFVSHRYEIKSLPGQFKTIAESPVCRYDMVRHKELPYIGIQGHPEASFDFYRTFPVCPSEREIDEASLNGIAIIKAFLKEFNLS